MEYFDEGDGGQLTFLTPEEQTNADGQRKSQTVRKPLSALAAIPYLHLDFTREHVDLFGSPYWELCSPCQAGRPPLNTGLAPRIPVRTALSDVLEPDPDWKYYLSKRACLGILRRAEERGRALPEVLGKALKLQAGLSTWEEAGISESSCVTAGFSAGAGASAGSIGYSEHVAPTLKASQSGSRMPSVLCLNDQGGGFMACTEGISGTLRSQEHGHQPLVFENHGIDGRCTGPHPVSPTLPARAGTGGGNLPLALQPGAALCIRGSGVERRTGNGGNGVGIQTEVTSIPTDTGRYAVFRRQRVDRFRADDTASTQSARQRKDATDLICQPTSDGPAVRLIRRLTPLECEALQGYPLRWTDLPGASDSARYKALGNSVAIPCVEFVLWGLLASAGKAEEG